MQGQFERVDESVPLFAEPLHPATSDGATKASLNASKAHQSNKFVSSLRSERDLVYTRHTAHRLSSRTTRNNILSQRKGERSNTQIRPNKGAKGARNYSCQISEVEDELKAQSTRHG